MLNSIRGGLLKLVLVGVVASGASGCAISYRDGNDKVDFSAAFFPGVGAATLKHTVYADNLRDVECAFDSSVVGNIFGGGAYEMRVSGKNREPIMGYRIEPNGMLGDRPDFKMKVWNSQGCSSDWLFSVPDSFPCKVEARVSGNSFSDLSGYTGYFNLKQEPVEPKNLLNKETRKFVDDNVRK